MHKRVMSLHIVFKSDNTRDKRIISVKNKNMLSMNECTNALRLYNVHVVFIRDNTRDKPIISINRSVGVVGKGYSGQSEN